MGVARRVSDQRPDAVIVIVSFFFDGTGIVVLIDRRGVVKRRHAQSVLGSAGERARAVREQKLTDFRAVRAPSTLIFMVNPLLRLAR
jgi:hypothetical protein